MILLRTESTQKHALIQHQYIVKKQNIIVLYFLRVFSGYILWIVTTIQKSEKKRSPFQFLIIKIQAPASSSIWSSFFMQKSHLKKRKLLHLLLKKSLIRKLSSKKSGEKLKVWSISSGGSDPKKKTRVFPIKAVPEFSSCQSVKISDHQASQPYL